MSTLTAVREAVDEVISHWLRNRAKRPGTALPRASAGWCAWCNVRPADQLTCASINVGWGIARTVVVLVASGHGAGAYVVPMARMPGSPAKPALRSRVRTGPASLGGMSRDDEIVCPTRHTGSAHMGDQAGVMDSCRVGVGDDVDDAFDRCQARARDAARSAVAASSIPTRYSATVIAATASSSLSSASVAASGDAKRLKLAGQRTASW